jgi:hypothetical protein
MERMINVNEVQKANDNRALTDVELETATGGGLLLGAIAGTLLLAAPFASTAAAVALLRS